MKLQHRDAIIFGTTKFVIDCIEYLQKKKWKVSVVVTLDHDVITWCEKNHIPAIAIIDILQIKVTNCYIFSIMNPYFIPTKFLTKVRPINAINYHDSLLPQYAGINSTTWAILNNETQHGVSWHEITSGIDEGDIYYQTKVNIENNDTALDLNLKCTEAALMGFKEIIHDIEQGKLYGIKQDLTKKTYFGREYIPINYAYVNLTDTDSYPNKLFNSLTFGDNYINPVASVKVKIAGHSYILEKKPKANYINEISTANYTIRNIYGKKITANLDFTNINKCYLNQYEVEYIQKLKKNELTTYHNMLDILAFSEINSGLLALSKIIDIVNDEVINPQLKISLDELVVFLSIILSRFNSNSTFIKIYYKNQDAVSELLSEITEEISVVPIKKLEDPNLSYSNLFTGVKNSIMQNKFDLNKDFAYRYKLDLCSEFAITSDYAENVDTHKVIFCLTDGKLTIKFSNEYRVIVEPIVQAIKVLSASSRLKCNLKIKDIPLLSAEDYKKIVYSWNETTKPYPCDKTIHQLFEEQVEKTPNNVAILFEGNQLTYNELNEKSNQLARYIRKEYQKRSHVELLSDTLIALCLDRGLEMLVGILATLKASGAYVPIDPNYPQERVNYILEDTNARLILTQHHLEKQSHEETHILEDTDKHDKYSIITNKVRLVLPKELLITIDLNNENIYKKDHPESKINLPLQNNTNNLAYVIYTSGTTGKPKGVMVEHKSLVNFAVYKKQYIKKKDIFASFINYTFDAMNTEIYPALINGSKLYILNNEVRNDIGMLYEFLLTNKISFLVLPALVLTELSKNDLAKTALTTIVYGGEVYNGKRFLDITYLNQYGPTESTVCATVHMYKLNDSNTNIGRPLNNIRLYILDQQCYPLPSGIAGELYIGGAGLARGYLNQVALTHDRFIVNPFQTEVEKLNGESERLYKTGDLARYLSNGDIEYIGRNDEQVKIRGFRIELGEIETVLCSFPGVKQATVLIKEDFGDNKNKYVVAYYVADKKLAETTMFNYLLNKLPEYMLPSYLVWLRKLPLTKHGKLDKKSLLVPEHGINYNYIAPRNETEAIVCKIYADVLGLVVDTVGINDDFFKLGGDSITSIQLVNRLRQILGMVVSVKEIFNCRIVKKLYDDVLFKQLESLNKEVIVLHENGVLKGTLGLLPIQKWFFTNKKLGLYPKYNHWNQSFLIKLGKLDLTVLKLALKQIIAYHDAFRLNYKYVTDKNEYIQHYNDEKVKIEIKILDISKFKQSQAQINYSAKQNILQEAEVLAILTDWQNKFDLDKPNPLYSIGYIYGYPDGSCRLYFAFHHLIVDAVSWRIITHDLELIYNKLILINEHERDKLEASTILGTKGTSYRQWVNLVNSYEMQQEENLYWEEKSARIKESNEKLKKLIDKKSSNTSVVAKLDKNTTKLLLTKVHTAYHTDVNDILLTAFAYAISKITGEIQNHITLEGHGREEIVNNINISNTVGWFTTMYPVELIVAREIRETLATTKDNLRRIINKGIGYGAIYGYQNLPQISFNYLGQFTDNSENIEPDKSYDEKITIWHIVNECSGESIAHENADKNIINVNGLVINDELQFDFKSKLERNVLDCLVEEFKSKLEEIVRYTSKLNRSYLTKSDINYIIAQDYLKKIQENTEISGVYLANSLQQGFIYHNLAQPKDTAYRVQLLFNYESELDEDILHKSWNGAMKKYPGLRLRFAWDNELVQIIDKEVKINWKYTDLSFKTKSMQTQTAQKIIKEDRCCGYNLSQGHLLRIHLIKLDQANYTCMLSSHHAILDGWSNSKLLNYVHTLYLELYQNLTEPDLQQKIINEIEEEEAYILTQKYLQNTAAKTEKYWQEKIYKVESYDDLNGLLKPDKRKIHLAEYSVINDRAEVEMIIRGNVYEKLRALCAHYEITVNALMQYILHRILNVYGNGTTTVTGTTVSGRNLPINGIEDSVGLYINTLPLIIEHASDSTLLAGIKNIQDRINELNTYSGMSLSKLQPHGTRLFDCLFIYENYSLGSVQSNDKIKFSFCGVIEELDYPLAVVINEKNNEIILTLKYAGELFDQLIMEDLLRIYKAFITDIISDPLKLNGKEFKYLDEKTFEKVIYTWNKTENYYPEDKTIHQLFEEQVEKTPDNIAVVYEDTKLTYQELNIQTNQLANYIIRTYKIKADDLIALCLDRSEYMLIGILAVLKAGGAYVPIDPSYPNERIRYILEDTKVNVVLTNEIHQYKLKTLTNNSDNRETADFNVSNIVAASQNVKTKQAETLRSFSSKTGIHWYNMECVLCLIDENKFQTKLRKESVLNPELNITSQNLAYVIYTSGTTGKPKGVMIEHRSSINTLSYMSQIYNCVLGNKVSEFTSYAFDVSVVEIFATLLAGKELHILTDELRVDVDRLSNYLLENNINISYLPPVILSNLNKITYDKLKLIIYAGEPCDKETGSYWSNTKKLYNYYGPTETAIYCLGKPIINGDVNLIGKPIANIQAYVLDSSLTPLPLGAIGELYIGGAGLARGYLNAPELTNEKFISNPFQSERDKSQNKNARLYKTGDLVRYLPDGNIEYIGRNDFQVKIRGYRIELGDIESKLVAYPEIKQAVVLLLEHKTNEQDHMVSNKNKYLVGYYVASTKLAEDEILKYLEEYLPEYMIPSVLVWLEKLPLTINGKLDRAALPAPEFTNKDTYVAPRDELEDRICGIYADVLGLAIEKIGIHDDFFKLGGDSILSIGLVNKLRQQLSLIISVKDISSYKTVAKLYDNVIVNNEKNKNFDTLREDGILNGNVPLLPIQEWFWSHVDRGLYEKFWHWNQAFLIKTPKLDIEVLKESIRLLVVYHDAFRLVFVEEYAAETKSSKVIHKQCYSTEINGATELKILNIRDLAEDKNNYSHNELTKEFGEVLTNWQNDFELSESKAYCIGYIHGYSDGSSRVFFALHHLIVDAISWRIICEDLQNLYNKLLLSNKQNKSANKMTKNVIVKNNMAAECALATEILGAKGTSYRQWEKIVSDYKEKHQDEVAYWSNILFDYPKTSKISWDKLVTNRTVSADTSFILDNSETNLLLGECNKIYNAEINALLLTALSAALYELGNSNIQHLVLEGHGREEIDSRVNVYRTVGWFTTMFPIRFDLSNIEKTNSDEVDKNKLVAYLNSLVNLIKENLNAIPNKGIGYGAIYGYVEPELPKISFNYLGQFNSTDTKDIEDNIYNKSQKWSIVGENPGIGVDTQNQDTNIININCMVMDGVFKASVVTRLGQKRTSKLAAKFRYYLKSLINSIEIKLFNAINANVNFHGCMNLLPSQERFFNIGLKNPKANLVTGLFELIHSIEFDKLEHAVKLLREKHLYLNVYSSREAQLMYVPLNNTSVNVEKQAFVTQDEMLNYLNLYMNKFILAKEIISFVLLNIKSEQYLFIIFPHFLGDRRCLGIINAGLDKIFSDGRYNITSDHYGIVEWQRILQEKGIQHKKYYDALFASNYYLKSVDRTKISIMKNITFDLPLLDKNRLKISVYHLIEVFFYILIQVEQINEDIIFNFILHGISEGFEYLRDSFLLLATYEPVWLQKDKLIQAIETKNSKYVEDKILKATSNAPNFIRYIFENNEPSKKRKLHNISPKIMVNYQAKKHIEKLNYLAETGIQLKNTYNLDETSQYLLSISIFEVENSYKVAINFSAANYILDNMLVVQKKMKEFLIGVKK